MASGSLKLKITDVVNAPIASAIQIKFVPAQESSGGTAMEATIAAGIKTDFKVRDIECRSGPGSLYKVTVASKNYRSYAFFQLIKEGPTNKPSDNQIRMIANANRIKDIAAPDYSGLDASLRRLLETAEPIARESEDNDLRGLQDAALYNALGPLRKACLLNIFKKASSASAGHTFGSIKKLLIARQDRCFCVVDPKLIDVLTKSERFKSAPNKLHTPLPDYERRISFKSRDEHANIQYTFQQNMKTGETAADVDIDEATGIEHGIEVIRNFTSGHRTNPYLIRELMVLSDPIELTLDPGYRFIWK